MKRFLTMAVAVFAIATFATNSQAGKNGVADLNITSLLAHHSVGGVIGAVVDDPLDVTVTGLSFTNTSQAQLGGASTGLIIGGGPDGPIAQVGSAIGNNTFVTPASAAPYARADSNATPSVVSFGGVVTPATGRNYSDLVLDDGFASTASASSQIANSATFAVKNPNGITIQFAASGTVERSVTGAATNPALPPGTFSHSTSFGLQLLGTGITVGGVQTNFFAWNPAAPTGTSVIGLTPFVGILSGEVFLAQGAYTFQATQGSALSYNGIPEPATYAAFALIGVCGLAARRRRRK